ncbi:MAG: hypothetical protein M1820_006218 [Bogoriella megaspora]|nr:MAG: hypothetical protein M1820_006218 [Bogoriella megaspora]
MALAVTGCPFRDAVDEFSSYFGKKRPPNFLVELKSGHLLCGEQVQSAMTQMGEEKFNGRVRVAINKIIEVMRDYNGILSALSQADPMPTALIWGGLKTAIECLGRHKDLQSDTQGQLERLTQELQRLSNYRDLFGHSKAMQEQLKSSYLNILRFWAKVDELCNRSGIVQAFRSLASFDLKKLDGILNDIKMDADNTAKLVPIIQERMRRGEHEDAMEERHRAGLALDSISTWVHEQRELNKKSDEERRTRRKKEVLKWLRGSFELNERNHRRQMDGEAALRKNAYRWLSDNKSFQDWIDPYSEECTIWLNGYPGTGKSVTCSFVSKTIRDQVPSAAVAYHYYSFDEQVPSTTVYRNIAEQLWDQLYSQQDDVSDAIHNLVSSQSDNIRSLYELLRLLLAELGSTYILLDGLDEECADPKGRWSEVAAVVNALTNLRNETSSIIKLWCSSQDHHCVHELLRAFPTITLDAEKNSSDIASFLEDVMPQLSASEVDPGTRKLMLEDLQRKAHGNFLWASLMVDSVSDAISPDDLEKRVHEGLPDEIEEYYARKVSRVPSQQRQLVSRLLSCVVYAKRPLLIEELCEASAMYTLDWGTDLSRGGQLFKDRIVELCAPLVKIEEIRGPTSKSICALTHASVRDFFLKKPRILSDGRPLDSDIVISPKILALSSLKYLSQPRYKRLLQRENERGTFKTANDQDVMEHHLLNYAAKYWDKHLDDIEDEDSLSQRVERFILSKQFITTIQVQCLFVGGIFQFWLSAAEPWAGPHLRRTFPHWFSNGQKSGRAISKQYYSAIGEWGYFLDEFASSRGLFSGEIDRCLWKTLPPDNFLRNFPCRNKSFILMERGEDPKTRPRRFLDDVDDTGEKVLVFHTEPSNGEQKINISCQCWEFRGTHSPRLKRDQILSIPTKALDLYERTLNVNVHGRPLPITSTTDQIFLRIGSQIFVSSKDGCYQEVEDLTENNEYFEEIANRNSCLAIGRRRKITREELQRPGLDDNIVLDFGKTYETMIENSANANRSSDHDSSETRNSSLRSSVSSSRTSLSSLEIESRADSAMSRKVEDDVLSSDWGSDADEQSCLSMSARESWSEGSTDPRSDETDDEDQWNDYASDEDEIDLRDSLSQISSTSSTSSLKIIDEEPEPTSSPVREEEDENGNLLLSSESEASSGPEAGSGSEAEASSFAESASSADFSYGDTDGQGSESEDDLNEGAAQLGTLLARGHRSAKASSKQERGQLVIYDIASNTSQPMFRFEYTCHDVLLDSPPIFHPLKDLVVWPLGGREILFADFRSKTYYTRFLRCSSPRSCHVFIQGRFSPCGSYLHLAALEARLEPETTIPSCILQVSTHRMSMRKTTRSPPRLIYRVAVPVGKATVFASGRMPYNLTWSAEHVYITASSTELRVIRVPLFRSQRGETALSCVPTGRVFFPNSTTQRNVRFFPPRPDAKAKDHATVIIGSHSPPPASSGPMMIRQAPSPPIGCFVNIEKDLGDWKPIHEVGDHDESYTQTKIGGRLQAKFEKFDTTDDCDIVPFIS